MKSFVAVITCLTSEYHKAISPSLITLGYEVSAGAASGKISVDKSAISTIGYLLKIESKNANQVRDDIKQICDSNKVYYYSCVVFQLSESAWCLGNIECETDPTRVLQLKALW